MCVGVVSSIAGGTARELLHAYVTSHPEIELQIVEGSPRDHIVAVAALKMDATLVVGIPKPLIAKWNRSPSSNSPPPESGCGYESVT